MPRIQVVYADGKPASGKKVDVSVDGGGMNSGQTDKNGYVTISTSGTNGKIFVNGFKEWDGPLEGAIVIAN